MITTQEQLEGFERQYVRFREELVAVARGHSTEDLRLLRTALRKVTRINVSWSMAQVAPILERIIADELAARRHR